MSGSLAVRIENDADAARIAYKPVFRPPLRPVPPSDPLLQPQRGAPAYMAALRRGYMRTNANQFRQAVGLFEEACRLKPDFAEARLALGWSLEVINRPSDAIVAYDELLARFSDASTQAQIAKALHNKANSLFALGRRNEAIAVYDDLLARFADTNELAIKVELSWAWVGKGFTLDALGRSEKAIEAYETLYDLIGEATEPLLQEPAACSLFNKGTILGARGDHQSAIETYDRLIEAFGQYSALIEWVIKALINKGASFTDLKGGDYAISAYEDAVFKFDAANDPPPPRELAAMALNNKALVFAGFNAFREDALPIFDELLSRFDNAVEPPLRAQVSKALFGKAITLYRLHRTDDAIATYDGLLARFGEAAEPPIREDVAKALVNKGAVLGNRGQFDEEIAIEDKLLLQFGEATALPLREQVAMALTNKGIVLARLGRDEEAIAVYDDTVARFGEASEPLLREAVARALAAKTNLFFQRGGHAAEGIAVCDDVVARFGATIDEIEPPAARQWVAMALISKAGFLEEINSQVADNVNNEKDELFAENQSYTGDDLRATTRLPPAEIAEKAFETMPIDTGPTKQEILQLTDEQLAQALARHTGTSADNANTIIRATQINEAAVVEASRKIVNRKPKLSKDDLTEAEMNDPEIIRENVEFARANTQTRISTLGEAEANKLRRARLIEKHDRDRRQKSFSPT